MDQKLVDKLIERAKRDFRRSPNDPALHHQLARGIRHALTGGQTLAAMPSAEPSRTPLTLHLL
jgi:hypothetical protein